MNDKIVKKTQDTLGKIIKKPPLTDKLLTKPPFRFLHDIITSVIKSTGFMKGLYDDADLNSENVKDKDSKVAFLQKAIEFVTLVNGKSASARPSKIVAGHEPEKTNEFLQALASAINKKVDNEEYVAKFKGGSGGGSSAKKERDSSADRRKRKDKDKEKDKEASKSRSASKKEEKKEDEEKDKKEKRRRDKDKGDRERSRDRERSKDRDKDRKHKDKDERSRDKDERSRDKEEKGRGRDRKDKDREGSRDGEDREKSRDKDRERRKPSSSAAKAKAPSMSSGKGPDASKGSKGSKLPKAPGIPKPSSMSKPPTKSGTAKKSEKSGRGGKSGKTGPEMLKPGDRRTLTRNKTQTVHRSHRSRESRDETKHVKEPKPKRREKEEDKENEEASMNGTADDGEKSRKDRKKDRRGAPNSDGEAEQDAEDEEQVRQEREREERKQKKEEVQMNGSAEDAPQPQNRRLARPSSARPAPPRIKKNEAQPEEQHHVIGSSNVPNLIVDKKDDSDDEDDGFMAKEDDISAPVENDQPETRTDGDEEGAEHGGLVKKILETKKELEGGSQQANKPLKKTEIERAGMNDATQRKHREMAQKEIEKLRAAIQTLTRSANPLGKIMDFVQEDMDQMQKEWEVWKTECKENGISLQREQSITESSIEPLKAILVELDSQIEDQLDVIAAVKSNVIRNDDKIEKMLSTVTKS